MFFKVLFLISTIFCGMITLGPNKAFEFEEEFEKDQLIKFEYDEEKNLPLNVVVLNEKNVVVIGYQQSSVTLHTKAPNNTTLKFIIENKNDTEAKVWFNLPNVLTELQGPLGPINETDIVNELKTILENIITSQRKHLEKQSEHENLLKRSKRLMTFLILFEGIFCAAVVYYLHSETIKLFEKKRRL